MKKINWLKLILSIAAVQLVGFLSGILSGDMKEIYSQLQHPPLSPPSWVFAPVWIALYAFMGIVLYLIYNGRNPGDSNTKKAFWLQLIFNFAWSLLFFRFGLWWISAIVIVVLALLILYTIKLLGRENTFARVLLVPYFLWVVFAAYLNVGFALLN